MSERTSRMPGFYKLKIEERMKIIADWADLTESEQQILSGQGLKAAQANMMIENVVGTYELPLGVACNFLINGRDYLVPMTVEEPSVLAAVSNSAKVVRDGGGFITEATDPVMIGQIQILDVPDLHQASSALAAHRDELIHVADSCDEVIVGLGGGTRDIEARQFSDSPVGPILVLHLYYDVRDAMGANTINTALEAIAPRVAELTGGRTSLRIISNMADRRTATAKCTIPAASLGTFGVSGASEAAPGMAASGVTAPGMTGPSVAAPTVARLIEEANAFAVVDPYRAATHNKGIMNGIDAVCIATGNDWRAIEAGAHSYAARNGNYTSLTDWHVDEDGDLYGELTLPMAVGIVGGATKVHPTARVALKILGVSSASELAQVMAAVGLAQNLAAIRALATVGIQSGHMQLHARQVAMAAGASESMAGKIAEQLVAEKQIHITRAKAILEEEA